MIIIIAISLSWVDDFMNTRDVNGGQERNPTDVFKYLIPVKIFASVVLLVSPPIVWYLNRSSMARWFRPLRKYPENHVIQKYKNLIRFICYVFYVGCLFLIHHFTFFFGRFTLTADNESSPLLWIMFFLLTSKFVFADLLIVVPIPPVPVLNDFFWIFISFIVNGIWFLCNCLIGFSFSRFIGSSFVGWGVTLILYQQFFPLANLYFALLLMINEAWDEFQQPYIFAKHMMLARCGPYMSFTQIKEANAKRAEGEKQFSPMPWETFYTLCYRARLESHHKKTLVRFFIQAIFIVCQKRY